jgi:hypothetical protein
MANQGDVRKVDNEIARKAEKPPSNFQDVMDAKTRAKEDKAIADNKKDMGERFGKGGTTQQRINKQDTKHGKLDLPVANLNRMAGMKGGGSVKESKAMVGKEMMFMKKKGAPASMMKHEKKEMGMKHGGTMKFAEGGKMPMEDGKPAFIGDGKGAMNMGGMAGMKKYAKGGGIESHGKTKGTIIKMATGGSVSSASRRADGIAQRGKTRC